MSLNTDEYRGINGNTSLNTDVFSSILPRDAWKNVKANMEMVTRSFKKSFTQ